MRRTEITIGMDGTLAVDTSSTNLRAGAETEERPDVSRHSQTRQSDYAATGATYSCRRRRRDHNGRPGLTHTIFDTLLLHLDPDRDAAGHKYERIRAKLLRFFERRGCEAPDQLTDETINRVAARLQAGTKMWCADLSSYFYGVARFVAREHRRLLARCPLSLDSLSKADGRGDAWMEMEHQAECRKREQHLEYLDLALDVLDPEARRVLLAYYNAEKGATVKNRAELADSLGIKGSALRTWVHRSRKKVRERFEELYLASLQRPNPDKTTSGAESQFVDSASEELLSSSASRSKVTRRLR